LQSPAHNNSTQRRQTYVKANPNDLQKLISREISWGHAPPYIENLRLQGRLVNRSLHRTFCAQSAVMQMEQSKGRLFGGILKILYCQILRIVGLCMCAKFRANRSLARLAEPFSEISLAPVEAFNNGMLWKVYSTVQISGDKLL